MKKILTFLLLLNGNFLFAQNCDQYCLRFEDTFCVSHLSIDTINFPDNIWQVGRPQKPFFNNASSPTHAILTDTINAYPVNNHSVFTITNQATMGVIYGFNMFSGMYKVQSDSLNDYGRMDFSPDNGTTWIDVFNDTVYHVVNWFTLTPVLTGTSDGWQYFDVLLADLGSVFNLSLGDTILYRFSFISDATVESMDGLMFDDFCFNDFVEGISETHFKPIKSKIYPNPSATVFSIDFENPLLESFELAVYDIHSKLQFKKENIRETKISVNANLFKPGIYVYKLTNLKSKQRSWGKFIKE